MNSRPLTAAALLLLAGCGEPDHSHDLDHAKDAPHDHAVPAKTPAEPTVATVGTSATPSEFQVGGWTARLEPSADGLRLTAIDTSGAAVTPAGEARVVLTGTGEEEQRVVLEPAGDGWSGGARATGAAGYVAVVSMDVEGHKETARVTWGEVPEAAPAREAEEPHHEAHGDGHDHGHEH
jgi:hypothetical protein